MNPTSLVALLACLSTVPACTLPAGSNGASGSAPSTALGVDPIPAGDWTCVTRAATTCVGQPAPSTPTVPSSGMFAMHLTEAYSGQDLGALRVTACSAYDELCTAPIAEAQTDARGGVTLGVASGILQTAYLKVSGAGMTDNYVYLARRSPAHAGGPVEITVYTTAALAITAGLSGVALDPARATVRVDVRDCSGAPAAGAQVRVGADGPVAAVRYFVGDGAALAADADATDATGIALGFGVAPGPVGVAARFDGLPAGGALGAARAGAVTSLVVAP